MPHGAPCPDLSVDSARAMTFRERLWRPGAVVFLSSACVMVVELVASRLVAPRLGVSLYTWTSVIGVILAGMSLGNYVGGRLADRHASPGFLGLVFALASISTLSILWLNNDLHDIPLASSVPLMVWVVGYIAGVFFVPSAILGCISPIVVKLSLTNLQKSGTTVGRIYSLSTAGSIVGTFATGFWLISWFGTKTIVAMVAGLLMVLAIWFLTDAPRRTAIWRAALCVGVFGIVVGLLSWGRFLNRECLLETDYFCIKVHDKEIGSRTVRELVLDRLVHSYSDLADPTYLHYGYERTYAQVIRPLLDRKPDLDVFFIGGGGYTFPRYLETILPESNLVVAEIDPGVTNVATQLLGLAEDTRIETHNLDARLFLLRRDASAVYDLVFGDAFNDYSVPFHLTTIEFSEMVYRALRDDGLYLVNIIDGGRRGHFFRAYVNTLRQVFDHVKVVAQDQGWRNSTRTTFVIAASKQPLDLVEIPSGSTLMGTEELDAYLAMEPPQILTDDHVPVDNLLAPVFADSARR